VQLEITLLFCELLWGRETLAYILNRSGISLLLPGPTMKPHISLIASIHFKHLLIGFRNSEKAV
jgi:hypothetical protein